ncbi:hypothetical protein [Butyrivibrio sp. LC3010]|uniref:hypothetical protein n=1 Tax=Butyrivibrio sp. LC3010 TaxID=1280680 RepID=UPI000400DBC0|nr:hypothetical protein [Butyrivibrio sp. LC3010]
MTKQEFIQKCNECYEKAFNTDVNEGFEKSSVFSLSIRAIKKCLDGLEDSDYSCDDCVRILLECLGVCKQRVKDIPMNEDQESLLDMAGQIELSNGLDMLYAVIEEETGDNGSLNIRKQLLNLVGSELLPEIDE